MTLHGFKTILHQKCRSSKNSEGPAENSWVLDLCPAKWKQISKDLNCIRSFEDFGLIFVIEQLLEFEVIREHICYMKTSDSFWFHKTWHFSFCIHKASYTHWHISGFAFTKCLTHTSLCTRNYSTHSHFAIINHLTLDWICIHKSSRNISNFVFTKPLILISNDKTI